MLRTTFTYGLIGGLIAGGLCFVSTTMLGEHIPYGWAMALGYTTMLIALSTIFLAVKRIRDDAPGSAIGFWPALGVGLAITLIAGLMYALGWECALATMGGSDAFITGYITRLRAEGGDPAAVAAQVRDMEAMRASYRNPLFRIPVSFTEIAPVGVLVSLVTAGLLRNPRILPAR
jgi:hypothetical protein